MEFKRSCYNLQSLNRFKNCYLKIGLLGGSFNPPHLGHIRISNLALKNLNLDYVIWLVSPQNPLKAQCNLSIHDRARLALKLINNNKILVSTVEYDLKYKYTYQILKYLNNHFPTIQFSWLAGADSACEMHRWCHSKIIPNIVNIAIFDRLDYTSKVIKSKIAERSKLKISSIQDSRVIFLRTKLFNISSTKIRSINHEQHNRKIKETNY